ncbi:MAG: ASKHA domain-containing protein [Lachnospiraceae bacterium]
MYRITFVKENKTIEVEENTTLLQAQIMAGLNPNAPCGGAGTCGKCKVNILSGDVTGVHRSCQIKVRADLEVDTASTESGHSLLVKGSTREVTLEPLELIPPVAASKPWYMVAFDVGTTSVVGYLLDGRTGQQIDTMSMLNPQAQFGADVIMRSNYVLEHEDTKLTEVIRTALNSIIATLTQKQSHTPEDVYQVAFVGNTCMHHLFLGISPQSLVLAPYKPALLGSLTVDASVYGISINTRGKLLVLPVIDGFVGADTVGCLVATDFEHKEKITLMIDIGTNGELVLGNKDKMVSSSTAAGPAFEGAKITCGMRGAAGAIDHVDMKDGKLFFTVIGDCKPIGICGSGLMDAIAMLVREGIVDESGHLEETYYLTEDVFINQKDVREVQLAKAAIAAGITLMSEYLNIEVEDIEEVLIAGAFGNYMNSDSACDIGLLPEVLRDRIIPIGNAAGEGAKIALLNHNEFLNTDALTEKVNFLELATVPKFQDIFVDQLAFGEE